MSWQPANMNKRKFFRNGKGFELVIYFHGAKGRKWAASLYGTSASNPIQVYSEDRRGLVRKLRLAILLNNDLKAAAAHKKLRPGMMDILEDAGWR